MHGHSDHLSTGLQVGLGMFYFLCLVLNLGMAYYCWIKKNDRHAYIWAGVGGAFLILSLVNFLHLNFRIPHAVTAGVNWAMNPVSYFIIFTAIFIAGLYFRKFFTSPPVAWTVLNISLFAFGWALTDPNFEAIITKPDNVPIVLLIGSVGFTTWLAMYKAVINDELMDRGEPPVEKTRSDKVLVWPDLVYTELLAMVICTFILIIWAIVLKAPLEPPSSTSKIPNPSKAPWYFLGLQEMLVYFDPWMAGVVLPSMIVNGLIAMPYIDFNPRGNGYYTFKQRTFAMSTWMFGFLVLWVVLIVLGTFLRGPNWNFYGPFEAWNPGKNVPLNNVNLSDYFWLYLLGKGIPEFWLLRELPGLLVVAVYMLVLPPLLAKTIMRPFFIKMGFIRFFLLVNLMQFMAALPIKMVLRWTINLKYIVFIPEAFFNI